MKISLLGNIINTKLIYKISDIKEGACFASLIFNVHFLNKKTMPISLNTGWYVALSPNKEGLHYTIRDNTIQKSMKLQDVKDSDSYKESIEKITTLRNKLVDIWKENQMDIPQLEF